MNYKYDRPDNWYNDWYDAWYDFAVLEEFIEEQHLQTRCCLSRLFRDSEFAISNLIHDTGATIVGLLQDIENNIDLSFELANQKMDFVHESLNNTVHVTADRTMNRIHGLDVSMTAQLNYIHSSLGYTIRTHSELLLNTLEKHDEFIKALIYASNRSIAGYIGVVNGQVTYTRTTLASDIAGVKQDIIDLHGTARMIAEMSSLIYQKQMLSAWEITYIKKSIENLSQNTYEYFKYLYERLDSIVEIVKPNFWEELGNVFSFDRSIGVGFGIGAGMAGIGGEADISVSRGFGIGNIGSTIAALLWKDPGITFDEIPDFNLLVEGTGRWVEANNRANQTIVSNNRQTGRALLTQTRYFGDELSRNTEDIHDGVAESSRLAGELLLLNNQDFSDKFLQKGEFLSLGVTGNWQKMLNGMEETSILSDENMLSMRDETDAQMLEKLDSFAISSLEKTGKLMTDTSSTISDGKIPMKSSAKLVAESTTDGLGVMKKDVPDVMSNVLSGMMIKMEAMHIALAAKAAAIAATIVSTLTSAFQIHSPSRVMVDIFENVMLGSVKGVEDNENKLYREIDEVAVGTMSRFREISGEIASHMGNTIRGGIAAQQSLVAAGAPALAYAGGGGSGGSSSQVQFTQNITTPKALSPAELTQEGLKLQAQLGWKLP